LRVLADHVRISLDARRRQCRAFGQFKQTIADGSLRTTMPVDFLEVTDSLGKVTVRDAKADVTVQNQNGLVEATGVTGTADLRTSFDSVRFSRIGKGVTVHAQNSVTRWARRRCGIRALEASILSLDWRRQPEASSPVPLRRSPGHSLRARPGRGTFSTCSNRCFSKSTRNFGRPPSIVPRSIFRE